MLATKSGVHLAKIGRFEFGTRMLEDADMTAIIKAFEAAGIEFGADGIRACRTATP